MNTKSIISILAVIANVFLAIGKITIGFFSKSSSILADGINSATDVVASTISYIGIIASEKPADKEHPYGHGKAEVISGFIITIIIFVSGIIIIYDAIKGFFIQKELTINYLAFGIMAFSALTNLIMSQLKIHYGKKHNSYSLISDGLHSRIDLLVSLGILISLFFVEYYQNIDSIIALIVGIYILKESLSLGKQTTDALLGTHAEEIEIEIKKQLKKQNINIIGIKTQRLGENVFAEISIKLPSKLKVEEASTLTKKIENQLISKIQHLSFVTIQIESHNIGLGNYKTLLGHQREFKHKKQTQERKGEGPGGYCICPKGDYKIKHKKGTPCSELKCPNHKINLIREQK